MQGLVLTTPVGDTVNKAIENGLLVISAGSDVLRMVPPLTITKENVDEMIEILRKSLVLKNFKTSHNTSKGRKVLCGVLLLH